jgi:hypothetical protein
MSSEGGPFDEVDALLLPPDLALVVDLTDAASDLSPLMDPVPPSPADDDLGLSIFPLPGILERRDPRNDRDEF